MHEFLLSALSLFVYISIWMNIHLTPIRKWIVISHFKCLKNQRSSFVIFTNFPSNQKRSSSLHILRKALHKPTKGSIHVFDIMTHSGWRVTYKVIFLMHILNSLTLYKHLNFSRLRYFSGTYFTLDKNLKHLRYSFLRLTRYAMDTSYEAWRHICFQWEELSMDFLWIPRRCTRRKHLWAREVPFWLSTLGWLTLNVDVLWHYRLRQISGSRHAISALSQNDMS